MKNPHKIQNIHCESNEQKKHNIHFKYSTNFAEFQKKKKLNNDVYLVTNVMR